ncbi:MAG: exosortase F system-associated protein [Bacteroidota bacterium]
MLNKLLQHKSKIAIVLLLVLILACVRAFEEVLFYDPFLEYYKTDYANLPFPELDKWKLFFGMGFRYFLNTTLSLIIIYVIFKDRELTKFASFLYILLFIVLMILFFGGLCFPIEENPFLLFYVRRFLIQPVFLILFLPAFYYQKLLLKK